MIAPGSTIGILGGGQLGRMLAVAAAQLGYRTHIYAPEEKCVADQVASGRTRANYRDEAALETFARACDVVTYEFENVPVDALPGVERHRPLRPALGALEIAQSRSAEKRFVNDLGGATAPYALAGDASELETAIASVGVPAIVKTDRLGYDGKGQVRLTEAPDAAELWNELGGRPLIVEGLIEFEREFSVIMVRGTDGEVRFWPLCENNHRDGILSETVLPAHPDIEAQRAKAEALAREIAERLDYVGVLTCEFFAGQNGPLFNEMAPRVHNSGHWTIEGAVTSQFENHIRAICGLPTGDTALAASRIEMNNLLGAEALDFARLFADPSAHVHLYGKADARPGRKMGHLTRLRF